MCWTISFLFLNCLPLCCLQTTRCTSAYIFAEEVLHKQKILFNLPLPVFASWITSGCTNRCYFTFAIWGCENLMVGIRAIIYWPTVWSGFWYKTEIVKTLQLLYIFYFGMHSIFFFLAKTDCRPLPPLPPRCAVRQKSPLKIAHSSILLHPTTSMFIGLHDCISHAEAFLILE